MTAQREYLIARLNQARQGLINLARQAPAGKCIYPDWTIKEYLDHIAGWDDVVVEALQAHAHGEPIPQTAACGINAYNARTVSTREALDLDHTWREFEVSRRMLIQALSDLPAEKFDQRMVFPWGETGSVADLIEIFIEHDETHAGHLEEWLQHPDQVIAGH